MKVCPRCDRLCLEDDSILNAISHIDNKTEICSICGQQSGMVDQGAVSDTVELEMQSRFYSRSKAK